MKNSLVSVITSSVTATLIGFVSLIIAIIAIVVTVFIMRRSNKLNKDIQRRNEQNSLCNDIEALVARYCTLVHKLFRASKDIYKLELKIALGNNEKDKKVQADYIKETEFLKDEINTIIYTISMKVSGVKELDNLVPRLEQLKEVSCYILDNEQQQFEKITAELRMELIDRMKEFKKTI